VVRVGWAENADSGPSGTFSFSFIFLISFQITISRVQTKFKSLF
jgi:hypothetical protein